MFGKNQIKAECGHETFLSDKITVKHKGKTVELKITISTKKPDYCHKCFEKMAIQCAWCGSYILPEDPITLYSPTEDFKLPEYAVVYKNDPLQLVGCLRCDCAESGCDRAGFWVVPGKVERGLSPIEQVIMTGNSVVVNDLSDRNKSKPIL